MLKSVNALRLSYLPLALGSALTLTACGDDDNDTNIVAVTPAPNDTPTNPNTGSNNTGNQPNTPPKPNDPPKTMNYEQILANMAGKPIDLPKANANLLTVKDKNGKTVVIQQGGYGSDAFVNPKNPKQFYALTDRGPNADVKNGMENADAKAFPVPTFAPQIGLFEIQDDGSIILLKTISLKRPDGSNATGLPNPNFGATNELAYGKNPNADYFDRLLLKDPSKPYDAKTNPTLTDPYGIDSEGLAVMNDGTFWVSDEYGPHIVHYDADGKELARINAFVSNEAGASTYKANGKIIYLPAEFQKRRPNRGMEGLTVTPDQKYLVGIMQSPMENPKAVAKKSNLTRIVRINLATGDIDQFLYRLERASDGKVLSDSNSGIVAINDHEFLVIERDSKFPITDATAVKKIYRIDLNGATNIESIKDNGDLKQDDRSGLLIGGKTLEEITADEKGWDTLKANNIVPVAKKEFMDLVKTFNYAHEKFEGILLFPNGQVGVINDDDFGISAQNDKDNKRDYVTQKYMDKAGTQIETNRVYIAPLNPYQAK